MKIDVLTPFPNMISPVMDTSIGRIAQEKDLVSLKSHDLRLFADNKHKKVDDYPFGGGDGMIMLAQPFFTGIDSILEQYPKDIKPRIIYPTPDGEVFTQKKAEELSTEENLIFICGHYKGIDQRVRDHYVTDEISIGDYVLTGGEIATLVIIDSVIRLISGVIGEMDSALSDSFSHPLLDCPWYTRPEEFRGYTVPEILMSGHHAKIDEWRNLKREEKTKLRRPDIYKNYKK